jgi:hypothetical protein
MGSLGGIGLTHVSPELCRGIAIFGRLRASTATPWRGVVGALAGCGSAQVNWCAGRRAGLGIPWSLFHVKRGARCFT